MKTFHAPPIPLQPHILILTFITLLIPLDLYGGDKDINIMVSCTEYIGNGKMRVYFGYENFSKKTVVIDETGSVITYNYGQSKKLGLYVFEPGVVESAFTEEFDAKDRVLWTVKMPNSDEEKTTEASINSNHCRDAPQSLNIIPGYNPPEGGKQYDSKIGAELTSLYNAYIYDPDNFEGATDAIFQLDGTQVLIEVVAFPGQYEGMLGSLLEVGFQVDTEDPVLFHAIGWLGIGELMKLNDFLDLFYARPVYPGVSNYIVPATGITNSQGDFAMHSDFVRLGYEVNGEGVKIGVLSNSFDTQEKAEQDVKNGDLPGAENPNGYLQEVHVLKDLGEAYGIQSDEGRAMLQIVHDIAPGAELAFRTGYLGEQDMADGISDLANAGCKVIVDDLSYITEPFFRDGVISQAIDEAVANQITILSSAGNFGRTSYCGLFNPAPAPATINGEAHDFGNGDIFQEIRLEDGDYLMVMQWDDGSVDDQSTTATDLDIFLSDDVGFSLLGFNRENIGGFPIEVVPFSVRGEDVVANIVVSRAAGPDVPVTFKYILFRGCTLFHILEHNQGNSTIVGHPNSEGAIAVGAVRYDKNQIYSPGVYDEPVIMSFSSMGGTLCEGIDRMKPDVTAPNGVNTMVDLGNGDWDGDDDDYPNFFGTSAASPHAAGVAALIMEAKGKYDLEYTVEPATIRELMKSTALEMENPGHDHISGSGFIQAHSAVMEFANPTPYIENLILTSQGLVPGEEVTPLSFTVTGDFFTNETEIYFRGASLETGVVFEDEHTITVDHPGFLGNPAIQAYTPEISASGLDGGFSEASYFSDPVKLRVVISANPAVKTFGEANPELSSEIQVYPLEGESVSLADAVLAGIVTQDEADLLSPHTYYLPADHMTDAGEVVIQPELEWYENPETELQHAITEKYILEFVNASLTIEKLPLMITPLDVELTYGEVLPDGLSFNYEITDPEAVIVDMGLLLAEVQAEHTGALANEITLVAGVTLVNGIPMVRGGALINNVRMIRGLAMINGMRILVEVDAGSTTVYVDGEPLISGGPLPRGLAMVNDLPYVPLTNIVRGVALVNGCELTLEEGCITMFNDEPVTPAVQAFRGLALVNGEALVGEYLVVAEEYGATMIGDEEVPPDGVTLINGITCIRGKALVNCGDILRGTALVNELAVPIENGIPDPRGLAIVNGIPIRRGSVLVNTLEIVVDYGEVVEVLENGLALSGITLENGIGVVRGVPLVNGDVLVNRGLALVNGLAILNGEIYSDDFVSLDDMSLLTSNTALTNGRVPDLRGKPLVNDLEGLDGLALKIAAGTILPDGTVIFENVIPNRGLALVNGGAYVRGVALVNDEVLANDNPVVNSSVIDENSNKGTILVFDATVDLTADPQTLMFDPICFITGTTAGNHWIVPGTYISKNFEITYGLGMLTIHPADVTVEPVESFLWINEGDPLPEFEFNYLGWIEGDAGNETYTVYRDSDGIPYDPSSDNSAGTYIVMPTPDNNNYTYAIEPAILHVNPYGPGTRAIRPVLNCIQEIEEEPYYIANFEYENRNNATVYIPAGPENLIEGTGINWEKSDAQPTMFVPGGGTFVVYFDGTDLSWSVASLDEDHKVSSSANANASSTKCPPVPKSASVSTEIEEPEGPDALKVYPNPVTGWLHITMKGLEDSEMITLHDLSGRSYKVPSVQVRSDLVEMDMNRLIPGTYLIRILLKDQVIFVPVIKN